MMMRKAFPLNKPAFNTNLKKFKIDKFDLEN